METNRTETSRADLSGLRIRRDEPGAGDRAGKGRRRAILAVLAAAGAAILIWGFLARGGPIEVETATVVRLSPASAQSLLTATGYVVAQRKADVASKGTGRLEVLNVVEGDRVKAGDIIGRIESDDVEAALAAARAAVRQADAEIVRAGALRKEAKLSFDRVRSLKDQALASESDLDAAEAVYESADAATQAAEASRAAAEANARWAEVQVENTYIRAPFDGTVLTKYADVGEVVAPLAASASSRGAVVTLADMGSLQVEADVSESSIRRIQTEQPCLVTLDAMPAEPYRGRVDKIVPTADRAKATVLVKVTFDALDERVLPEMSAKVSFLPETADAAAPTAAVLSVPRGAIAERGGRRVVFVVEKERVREAAIETGATYGGSVEVREGLSADEIVVLDPPGDLKGGGRVRVKTS